ncbi:hypothetical protein PUNSTDRAFT_80797 [Punctularia strigosozonata HHB-11173 SS5]|uniref:uncharacterized protein n=1 Tax=Punctularia strigosozonata (strain HHB-11173) TaxID=741275 RepID=UPI00044172B6|nr:uncharacterized protein PUNSTDRAFT_80797 [Punctularia strigosozonata HHB-11173 SS5]EIN14437.1 hypothetical protein PUNSTDRAFT_80797 [Punctularia strigosozonata HHB-11173 SS5]
MPILSDETCPTHHDWFTAVLTGGLCLGLIISYLPQHFRIISKGSSEGFSPWFLLLGSTSAASGMLNMITMQWTIIRCCRALTFGGCIEVTAGVFQVGLQWLMFTIILVLYMIYYPPHLKYVELDDDAQNIHHLKTHVKTDSWRLSITLSWVVFVHILLITFVTFLLLGTTTTFPRPPVVDIWATFLGVASAVLAAVQYAPQIVHTYRMKLVGALSIPMMCIQSPGAVLMVLSIALRPGTNWTSWITFAVAGLMQGSLLIMCILWKIRQRKLQIDDFGHSITPSSSGAPEEYVPVPVAQGPQEGGSIHEAVEYAVEEDIRAYREDHGTGEATPLLHSQGDQKKAKLTSWLPWKR